MPIFDEDERTINRLFSSLLMQTDVSRDSFEVICLINNDLPGTKNYDRIFSANQKALSMEWFKESFKDLHIVALDHSSVGKEILGCNIGKVRNLLVQTAAARFDTNEHNGILLHIDADVYFGDPLFIRKAIDLFHDPTVVGVIGGKWREAFLADYPEYDPTLLRAALEHIGLSKQCKELSNFLKGRRVLEAFGGSNMLARCRESITIGGIADLAVEEDKEFGYRLWQYVKENGQKILTKKTELKVVASLRISERTGSSFKDEIEQFFRGEELIVKHPATPERLVVSKGTYELLKARALKLAGGEELVEYIEDYGRLWIHD